MPDWIPPILWLASESEKPSKKLIPDLKKYYAITKTKFQLHNTETYDLFSWIAWIEDCNIQQNLCAYNIFQPQNAENIKQKVKKS